MKGGSLIDDKRLQMTRYRKKVDNLSVLLNFEDLVLPEKVRIGYMI